LASRRSSLAARSGGAAFGQEARGGGVAWRRAAALDLELALVWVLASWASVGEGQVLGFDPFTVYDLYCVMGLHFGYQLLESVLDSYL